MTKKKQPLKFDLSNASDARRFMRGFRMPNGARLEVVYLSNGTNLEVCLATDSEVMQIASQIYKELYQPCRGEHYYYEEELVQ